jgi:uncharacterized protein (TIGR02421 family)
MRAPEAKEKSRPSRITKRLSERICKRLAANERVRRNLPVWGRVHIDRQLPFLCVYRRPVRRRDVGTDRLLLGEASYLTSSGRRSLHPGLKLLIGDVANTLAPEFGAFLIVEIWSAADPAENDPGGPDPTRPVFTVFAPASRGLLSTVDGFRRALAGVRVHGSAADVSVVHRRKTSPPDFPPLISRADADALGTVVVGLEVSPIYRDAEADNVFSLVLRRFRRELAKALKRGMHAFIRSRTTHTPPNYQSLGRHAVVKAVWNVDRQLAAIDADFDFLLLVSPTNTDAAWSQFRRSGFEAAPTFLYRPLPIEPALLKRALYSIRIEDIEDPVLAQLFRQKQEELDLRISLLSTRNSRRFLHASQQLFGGVDDDQWSIASDIFDRLPPACGESVGRAIDARQFARHVEEEIQYYRGVCGKFDGTVEIRDDVAGLVVSRGLVLVGKSVRISRARVEALLQHEVGTHLLTYNNGLAQPFMQLSSGTAGCESLQEGLAVLAEHLCGGLPGWRLRMLAARAAAVRSLCDGASFVETFRLLEGTYGFAPRIAFGIASRVCRGGGLTKDAIYLKGLCSLLDYLRDGGDTNCLFVGKIGLNHVPVVKELLSRSILHPAPVSPRYMQTPESAQRLEHLRAGLSPFDLVKTDK